MKIADISENYHNATNDRIKEAADKPKEPPFDHEAHKQWQKDTQNVDQKEYDAWRKKAGIKTESPELKEKAPPGAKAERFIKKNKAEFKDRYGDRWEEVLYSTAWKKFGESTELGESPMVVSHPDAIQHAIAKTQKWLERVMDYEHDIEDLNLLGDVVGFHVVPRGDGDKVMFEDKENKNV